MAGSYTDVVFSSRQPDMITATKLNKLRDDLSAALDSLTSVYSGAWVWTVSTTSAAPQGSVGINATSWTSATAVNISPITANGRDLTAQIDAFQVGDEIYIQVTGDSTTFAKYAITALPVSMTGFGRMTPTGPWYQVAVSYLSSGGAAMPSNNQGMTVNLIIKGAGGGGGTGTGDMTKAIYDTNNNNVVDTCDSLAWSKLTGVPATFPPDSTAMLKSVYDTNNNGIVDTADSIPWGSVTGKPATIGDMLKSVYDVNGNNIVDTAESANAAPWAGITGKPATFPPTVHAPTHLDNGSDPIPVVTTSRTGLAPTLNGNAATYLNGTGAYSAVSGSVNPGTWTNVTLGTGWTAPTQAQYRVEVNGAVSTVFFRGMVQAAYSAMATTALTVPAGAQPSMTRSTVLGGAQATGTPSDVASYIASMSSAGVCTVFALGAGPFCWFDPSQTQQVYLEGLFYSL